MNFWQRKKTTRLRNLNLYTPHSPRRFTALDSWLLIKSRHSCGKFQQLRWGQDGYSLNNGITGEL